MIQKRVHAYPPVRECSMSTETGEWKFSLCQMTGKLIKCHNYHRMISIPLGLAEYYGIGS